MIKKVVYLFGLFFVFGSLLGFANVSYATEDPLVEPSSKNWLTSVDDAKSIFSLSLPGTHDTMAYQGSWISGGYIKQYTQTQNLSLADQLNSGIRFLDLRVGKNMAMQHGFVNLKSRFDTDVMPAIQNFLTTNPSETLVLRIKDEENPESVAFDTQIGAIIANYQEMFVTNDNQTLLLGDIRGKVVVIDNTATRSFATRNASPIRWGDGAKMKIQDNYDNPSFDVKYNEITNLLAEANASPAALLYANHVSATGKISLWRGNGPIQYANNLNPRVTNYIANENINYTGILIFDFITEDISKTIYQKNI